MKTLTGFLGLLYDLIIGDCWQVTAGVVAVLAAGVGLLRFEVVPASSVAVFLGAAIMSAGALIIYFEARASYRAQQPGE